VPGGIHCISAVHFQKCSKFSIFFTLNISTIFSPPKRRGRRKAHIYASMAVKCQSFDQATVMFSSLIGFTELSARCSPATLALCVNSVFDVFDSIVDCHNVFKAPSHSLLFDRRIHEINYLSLVVCPLYHSSLVKKRKTLNCKSRCNSVTFCDIAMCSFVCFFISYLFSCYFTFCHSYSLLLF